MSEGGAVVTAVADTEAAKELGERALLGVRPEDISPEGGPHPGRVRVVEDMGPSKVLLVDLAGCAVRILVPTSNTAEPGDEVRPKVDPKRVVLWPVDS